MAFTIPNEAAAAFPRQAVIFQADVDALVAGQAGTGVDSGGAVTAQGAPDMTVAVAAGVARIGGVPVTIGAGNVAITAADGTHPRIDLVVVDDTGTKDAVDGTAAASPAAPALPVDVALLAQVYVPAGDTDVDANQIVDKRVATPGPHVLLWDGDSYELVTGATIYADPDGTGAGSAGTDPGDIYVGPGRLVINAQTGTAYTADVTDEDKLVTLANAAAITLTLPTDASEALPIGAQIHFAQTGAGQVTAVAEGGATVNGTPGLKARAQWSAFTAIKRAANTWLLVGDLAA